MKMEEHYAELTNVIIEELEKGVVPWRQTWEGNQMVFPKRHNGENYSGLNVITLWVYAMKLKYVSPFWMTYKQAKELGGCVKKGEKSTSVFYSGVLKIEDETQSEKKEIPYRKKYSVFNAEQIEGLADEYYKTKYPEIEKAPVSKNNLADIFITKSKATIIEEGNQPLFNPTHDKILMPSINTFSNSDSYYSTLFHELTHWTGHKSRLNREECYAMEELIAELGSVFLSVENNVEIDIKNDHAPYIASWLKALKNDNNFIIKASSSSQKAVNYLKELQEKK